MSPKPETLPVILESIPEDIRAIDRWICWKWELRKGNWSKTPRQTNGHLASTSDRASWTDFDASCHALKQEGRGFDGLGFVLPPGIVGIDLDNCIGSEGFSEESKMLLAMLPNTYCEVSPSGTGVKLLATGQLNLKMTTISHKKGVELYDGAKTNRFFCITGHVVDDRHVITGQRDGLYKIQSILTEPIAEQTRIEPSSDHVAKALELLPHLRSERADHYDEWLAVGMALSWCDKSDEMLHHWIDWSSKSHKFNEEVCRSKWESFFREEGRIVTIRTLERLAAEDGYRPKQFRTLAIRGNELLAKDVTRDYLIENMLVRHEPMIIGGASKTLKTTIALDMAVSITTQTPFMEKFAVPHLRRVMFLSGESGEATLQESLRLIAAQKGLTNEALQFLHVGFRLPKLSKDGHVEDLIEELQENEIDIVFIDPLYRCLNVGDGASNVYAMGEQLDSIAEKIHRAGITAVLLHHFRKQGNSHSEQPELEDLSQAGVGEFGRQFLLLKRRVKYQLDGHHELWFGWGGSAGHQGMRILEATTGVRSTGLTWQTKLHTMEDWEAAQEEDKAAREEVRAAIKEEKKKDFREGLMAKIFTLIEGKPGVNGSEIHDEVGGKRSLLFEILGLMESSEDIYHEPGPKNSKLYYVHC